MAIYDLNNTVRIGRPARFFDANGAAIEKVLRANTETGEVTKFKTDQDGHVLPNADGTAADTESIVVPAPLRLEFRTPV